MRIYKARIITVVTQNNVTKNYNYFHLISSKRHFCRTFVYLFHLYEDNIHAIDDACTAKQVLYKNSEIQHTSHKSKVTIFCIYNTCKCEMRRIIVVVYEDRSCVCVCDVC